MKSTNQGSPLGDVIRPSQRRPDGTERNRRLIAVGVAGIGALSVYAVLAAAFNIGGSIQRASDVVDAPSCNAGTQIVMDHAVDSSGNSRVSSVKVTGINVRCDGSPVALVFVGQSGEILDEIVWVLDVQNGGQSITAIADGSTTATANVTTAGVSMNYPTNQTSPEGLSANLMAESVFGVTFIDIPSQRAARF
jgi:hypothetical protein